MFKRGVVAEGVRGYELYIFGQRGGLVGCKNDVAAIREIMHQAIIFNAEGFIAFCDGDRAKFFGVGKRHGGNLLNVYTKMDSIKGKRGEDVRVDNGNGVGDNEVFYFFSV